jgi:heat-inducible transcriptional repressor
MISDRQKAILFAMIEEHVKTAQPISSQMVCETFDFDVSPATMRSEIARLEEEGYLSQPHTSAGRVPTDKGYRLFVDALVLHKERENKKARSALCHITNLEQETYAAFAELARAVATLAGSTVFSGSLRSHAFFKAGVHDTLSQPELEDSVLRKRFGDMVDSIEKDLPAFADVLEHNKPAVFIGKENPLLKARDFSMLVSRCKISGGDGVVVILGPKRMNYRRSLDALDALCDFLD